jgi:hypothetical protein
MNNSGAVAAIVTIAGLVLSELGVTGIDSSMLNNAINGLVSVGVVAAALWSWHKHHDTPAA